MILGPLTLPDELTLDIGQPEIGTNHRRLLGGAAVTTVDSAQGGRELTLNSEGHLLVADKERIRDLQATGQEQVLVHARGTFTVFIIDTSALKDDTPRVDPENDPELTCSGDIILREL